MKTIEMIEPTHSTRQAVFSLKARKCKYIAKNPKSKLVHHYKELDKYPEFTNEKCVDHALLLDDESTFYLIELKGGDTEYGHIQIANTFNIFRNRYNLRCDRIEGRIVCTRTKEVRSATSNEYRKAIRMIVRHNINVIVKQGQYTEKL